MTAPDEAGWVRKVASLAVPGRVRVYPFMVAGIFLCVWVWSCFVAGDGVLDAWGHFVGNDFVAFYTGAQLWRAGEGPGLYDFATQAAFQRALAPVDPALVTPMVNPPHALVLYLPFSFLGYQPALLAWWVFTGGCLWAALRMTWRGLPGLGSRPFAHMLLLCGGFFPTLMWLAYGQVTPLALLLWTLAFFALRSGQDLRAGLWLSLLAFKPQLALPPVLILLAARRGRALLGGVLGGIATIAFTLLCFPDELVAWLGQAPSYVGMLRAADYATWGIHSWFGFSALLLDGLSPRLADVLTVLASVATLTIPVRLFWRSPWRPGTQAWDLAMAAALCAGLLCCVQLFTYDLLLLLLPLLVVVSRLQSARSDRYLDAGPVLAWSVLLFVALFASSQLSRLQSALTATSGLPPIACQVSVFLLVGWSLAVARIAHTDVPDGVGRALDKAAVTEKN